MGVGEQGVLLVRLYKDEILPLWRFRTPEIAEASARAIFALFEGYRDQGDFVGMDMARKFLQMGITRSRRYANHASGRKYVPGTRTVLPTSVDPGKARSAEAFREWYLKSMADPVYAEAVRRHKEAFRSGREKGRAKKKPPGLRRRAFGAG